jgi:peptide/nickel transport system substrate-binding protein
VTAKKVRATPGMTSTDFSQSVIIALWVNNEKKPFHDPCVRRALHLALDRHALLEVVKEVMPAMVGGFIYAFRMGDPSGGVVQTARLPARP